MAKPCKYEIVGYSIIAFGIFFNEFTIKYILKWGARFNSPLKIFLLIIFQLIIISIGIFIIRDKKEAIIKLITISLSTIVILLFLELILSLKIFNNLSSENPIWIPAKYKNISAEFNRIHKENSKNNEHGFNDVNHTKLKKNNSTFRIAILGDSFVWGAGIPDSIIWTNKLAKIFKEKGLDCEILSWGKNSWSTLDEYNFMIKEGSKYKYDFLIYAFVVNDPVMDSSLPEDLIFLDGFISKYFLYPMSLVIPNDISFFTAIINNITSIYFDLGYMKWINKIYSNDNLIKYSTLIGKIKNYCDTNNIKLCFVMTPENHGVQLKTYFDKIIPILNEHYVPYLNLYPNVSIELGDYPNRALWANPADGHPGNLVTELYAKYVFEYLNKELPNQALKLTE